LRYARRFLGDVDLAREVVQDTFLKLWQADREHVEDHLVKWLYTVCRNRALDVSKKEGRMITLEQATIARVPAPRVRHAGMADAEENSGLLESLGRLPDRQQEVVRLKFQGELSYQEIADIMHITRNNVGVLLHTALKNLRARVLQPEHVPPGGPISEDES